MKKIIAMCFLLLLTFSAYNTQAFDPNRGVVYYTNTAATSQKNQTKPVALVISNIGIAKQYPWILDGLTEKVSQAKTPFTFIVGPKVDTQFGEFMEDKQYTNPDQLTRADIKEFGDLYGYDRVAVLRFNETAQRNSSDVAIIVWSANKTLAAELVAKIVDTQTGSYLYRKDIVKEAGSKNVAPWIVRSHSSLVNAWSRAADLCVQEFLDDLAKI
ncbi:hypothetical protein [Sporomusa sphaeroides]|uniref:hypothetical protein n=1 Tax=Sporomusa sphaeroides TaxID=47679 RepID=UPI002C7FE901|nr:hypothetical protein [Sporomusa sphaeroides]HML33859.1 hypothetical protein [Sporomusa sphaeroides]